MWPDNETDRDFLNFTVVADTVAEIIIQANGRPVSIGVSGDWGVGKSSMIKLIRHALVKREQGESGGKFLFVEFNAWLYQGYDDARAALMEVIGTELEAWAKDKKTGLEKVKELLQRVDWFRAAKLTAGSLAMLNFGLPPTGLVGEAYRLAKQIITDQMDKGRTSETGAPIPEPNMEAKGLLKPKRESTPPKEISAIRECFEQALSEMKITLVVLIDDLDRCLPSTTISTLEAIRLFLFLQNTAFVIAADDKMIRYAVARHFEGLNTESDLVTSYFDKLIQIPISVPRLGIQEIRAYMMLLFVDNSTLSQLDKEDLRSKVCCQLGLTWQGKRVDKAFMESAHLTLPSPLIAQFDVADRLAPIMATSSKIAGNPRLIKRFLNVISIRMAIARIHGVGVDEAILAKMLLFERCGESKAYAELIKAVSEDNEGKPRFLAEWEEKALAGEELNLESPWGGDFVREWLTILPRVANHDLRGVVYVSREHVQLITPEDRLSSEAAELLEALLVHPDMADRLGDRLAQVPIPEISIIMDRLLDKARQEQEWGVPPILNACLIVGEKHPSQGLRFAAFLRERPAVQIKASIVPKISDQSWASDVFSAWNAMEVSQNVKRAITHSTGVTDGNVTV